MVATIGQMASAEYYLESQRSYRHPNEYYTAGEEPDGTWFNPKGLLDLEDGVKVDSAEFSHLYNGFAPDGSAKLVRWAGSQNRSPGVDMTFSVDKSVSALWALAEPEMRERIEGIAVVAARAALEDTVLKYSSYTRVQERGVTRSVEADLLGATFVHGTSRENDPQLHVHCAIFNLARTHEDGKWRAHHQYPVYSWKKAAGASFRAYMAWDLQQTLGVRMEQCGPKAEFTRIEGMPDDLQSFWSKRRKAIIAKAGELGIPSLGNASRMAGVNKLTREGKSHDNDPEVRHRRWRDEGSSFVERETLIESVTGHDVHIPREAIRALTDRLDDLPAHLAREEAVFRRPDMVEAAANAAAGLMGREAVGTAIERLRRNPEIERLEPKKPTAESKAGMVHTEVYSTRHNLGLEQAVKDMAEAMAAGTGHGLPEQGVEEKLHALLEQGYPLSQEQSLAIRHATARGGRVAVIEGAAGSGKTTTLRPITDLHREHGYEIVPTAVAWRTAVALGDDCDARPYCVDKLLKLAAKGQIEIGRKTLIVVDEAGMLSTRQAHHILQLSERHGAKVVFAGDTRQQQPVEAGPGLRLIRDVAGSVRVDRIRRQKADLEDVLVHVHGETPEQARFRAGLTSPEERDTVLAEYEAMEKKPVFTPWQVSVSEALRDGDAEQAIEAWRLRGRFHLCHDEEKTLTRLVEDWTRHVKAEPDSSTVVLARTRAEARALSWLMRERVLGARTDIKRAVIEVSRDLDGRVTEPLEIAVSDRLRVGATQWEKQLFNGTVVTVEDLEVRRGQERTTKRKAGKGGRDEAEARTGEPEPGQPSVFITARTDDGRRVSFRHDEIRDYKDNIRLDYGYAMTIASAQGLTVDRAFLLVDDRPARETIYPAATRHREGIDIYVNRSPLVFDIADRRPEDEAERPVLDSDVRAYLAERWSRSQPKEAALDYTTDGMWRDARQEAPRHDRGAGADGEETAEARTAANDNALVRIARDIRHAVSGWRHGPAADAFAAERAEVLVAWDALRERTRQEGNAVALSPAFRETLDRHGALMKQAASFSARPQIFERLLAERGGIADSDLEELRQQHARAASYLRSVNARTSYAARQNAERERSRTDETVTAEATDRSAEAPVQERVQGQQTEPVPPDPNQDAELGWETIYDRLERDWNYLVAVANKAGLPLPLARGYEGHYWPRAESRAPSGTSPCGAGGADRTARLRPERDCCSHSRRRLPRRCGTSCKGIRVPRARSGTPGRSHRERLRLVGVAAGSAAFGRGRPGHTCRRGHLRRLSRRCCRRKAPRAADCRPDAQPHRGRPRRGRRTGGTQASPQAGPETGGRHRLYPRRPREAPGVAGTAQEARAEGWPATNEKPRVEHVARVASLSFVPAVKSSLFFLFTGNGFPHRVPAGLDMPHSPVAKLPLPFTLLHVAAGCFRSGLASPRARSVYRPPASGTIAMPSWCPAPLRSAGPPTWPRNRQCTNIRTGPVAGGRPPASTTSRSACPV